MPEYSYLAIGHKGDEVRGCLTADHELELEYKLKELGLELASCRLKRRFNLARISASINDKELILFCTYFEQLEKAGVPILDIIEDLHDSARNSLMRDLIKDLHESVKSGLMLSESLKRHTAIFDEVFIGLIEVGEKTGNLAQSFHYLSAHLKWNREIKSKTKKAIRYPLFLLIVMIGVIALMMGMVIPKLVDFLVQQELELPFYTHALIVSSNFFLANWLYLLLLFPSFLACHKIFYKFFAQYALFYDALLLKIPIIGAALLKIDMARFSQFFLISFKSGIDILACFKIVQKVIANKDLSLRIEQVISEVSEGSVISTALKNSHKFPHLVIRMFEIGERSGNMSAALENVTFFYDAEVNDSVEAIVGVIKPALTIIMGGLLLWITMAVFGPLYGSFGEL